MLLALHVLILAHLAHWLLTGRSLGRLVLSDAMEALELGRVGPGAILFALAILTTLVAGRWLCGWACHMGALQDGCAWLLRRAGLRPRPFRTRLLGYVPLLAAFMMFAWPTLRRELLAPLASALPSILPPALTTRAPPPVWRWRLTSDDLWRGLPSAAVAIPFLLVCGGATVFFLGSRGFCRYGCPYGGAFAAAEPIAPLRVVVDMTLCDGCGRCTAACTSDVRVHEEVRSHGRVIANGCLKSLDCVAACPQQALQLSLTKPALVASSTVPTAGRFDTSWPEEILVAGTFVLALLASRGLYGLIPLFFALGIATSVASATWILWRSLRSGAASVCGWTIKRGGRWTQTGRVCIGAAALLWAIMVHSLGIQACFWRAAQLDNRIATDRATAFSTAPSVLDANAERTARQALAWYLTGGSLTRGGWGIADTPSALLRVGWLRLLLRDYHGAADALEAALPWAEKPDRLAADLAGVLLLAGDADAAVDVLEHSIATSDQSDECRRLLGIVRPRGDQPRARERRGASED